jgi:hypothetical protein
LVQKRGVLQVELVLSSVLAISTVAYTIINLMMWKESRATRKQKMAPFIVAYLKTTENHKILTLIIKNIGEGLAKNVKINVLKDYRLFGDSDLLSDSGMIKNGINSFPPQLEMRFYINLMTDLNPNDKDSKIEISVYFEDIFKNQFTNLYELPFNQSIGQHYSSPPETYIGQIPYYLKEIHKVLNEKNKK